VYLNDSLLGRWQLIKGKPDISFGLREVVTYRARQDKLVYLVKDYFKEFNIKVIHKGPPVCQLACQAFEDYTLKQLIETHGRHMTLKVFRFRNVENRVR
jgi:hypothetical protein